MSARPYVLLTIVSENGDKRRDRPTFVNSAHIVKVDVADHTDRAAGSWIGTSDGNSHRVREDAAAIAYAASGHVVRPGVPPDGL